MIDTTSETCYMLRDLARRIKPPVSYKSLLRWCTAGTVIGGTAIRMESVRRPAGLASSEEAYHRFITCMTEAQQPTVCGKR